MYIYRIRTENKHLLVTHEDKITEEEFLSIFKECCTQELKEDSFPSSSTAINTLGRMCRHYGFKVFSNNIPIEAEIDLQEQHFYKRKSTF